MNKIIISVSVAVLFMLGVQQYRVGLLNDEIEKKNKELTISALQLEIERGSTQQCQIEIERQNKAISEQEVAYLSAQQQIDELRRGNVPKRTEIVKEFILDPSCTNQLVIMERQLSELLSTIGGER